jgi:lipoprotein-releasing system ATP-binding protein
LGTLDLPDSGIVKINGKDVSKISEKETSQLRNKALGFVFQFHHLLPEFTAFENVLIPSLIRETSQEVRSRAFELFEFMNLTERMTHYPQQLSGGERQRVAIMRALIQKPALVLADEPTGNLDKTNTKILLDLIKKISDKFKQTFLIATHDTMVAQIAHRRFCLIDSTLNVMDNL